MTNYTRGLDTRYLLTIDEAVGVTRLSRSSLYVLFKHGVLPFVQLGRRRFVPAKAIVEFLEAHTVQGKSTGGDR